MKAIVAVVATAVLLSTPVWSNPFLGPDTVSNIVEKAGNAVVSIQARKSMTRGEVPRSHGFPFFFRQPQKRAQLGEGSGFIYDQSGQILTNYHVIAGADEIMVSLSDGREYKATVKAQKPELDLAMLQIQDPAFSGKLEKHFVSEIGDSESLKVGEWVVAIGSPFSLDRTVTVGIVSAKGRNLNVGPGAQYNNLIQTDASINPGNSGGPLLNLKGEVVGINTAMKPGGQGLGFAIPVNLARRMIEDLREHGEIKDGYLGIVVQNLSQQLQDYLGLKTARGSLVQKVVPGSPAAIAGFVRGDLITHLNGKEIENKEILVEKLLEFQAGEKIDFRVMRKGQQVDLEAKLAARSSA